MSTSSDTMMNIMIIMIMIFIIMIIITMIVIMLCWREKRVSGCGLIWICLIQIGGAIHRLCLTMLTMPTPRYNTIPRYNATANLNTLQWFAVSCKVLLFLSDDNLEYKTSPDEQKSIEGIFQPPTTIHWYGQQLEATHLRNERPISNPNCLAAFSCAYGGRGGGGCESRSVVVSLCVGPLLASSKSLRCSV